MQIKNATIDLIIANLIREIGFEFDFMVCVTANPKLHRNILWTRSQVFVYSTIELDGKGKYRQSFLTNF